MLGLHKVVGPVLISITAACIKNEMLPQTMHLDSTLGVIFERYPRAALAGGPNVVIKPPKPLFVTRQRTP